MKYVNRIEQIAKTCKDQKDQLYLLWHVVILNLPMILVHICAHFARRIRGLQLSSCHARGQLNQNKHKFDLFDHSFASCT